MRKLIVFITVTLMLVLFASCTKVSQKQNNDSEAWWNNTPADTAEFHFEIGYAKESTLQTSRDLAKANANTALAQYVSNVVDAIVTTYVNDAGEVASNKNNMQALQAFESVSKQQAQTLLTGVQYKFQVMPDGGVYVLASLPKGKVAEELKKQARESFVKNEASESANEAIAKYFAN